MLVRRRASLQCTLQQPFFTRNRDSVVIIPRNHFVDHTFPLLTRRQSLLDLSLRDGDELCGGSGRSQIARRLVDLAIPDQSLFLVLLDRHSLHHVLDALLLRLDVCNRLPYSSRLPSVTLTEQAERVMASFEIGGNPVIIRVRLPVVRPQHNRNRLAKLVQLQTACMG